MAQSKAGDWEARALELVERRWKLIVLLTWLGFCGRWIYSNSWSIRWFGLPDTDDNMRIMQVRALLHGQGWFDLRQYRMNPPFGENIHWSRLVDLPIAGLLRDLKQRGLLDDTLVIWGGEFGRTIYSQGELTADNYGRDHHPRCFTLWLAGGGAKPGVSHGETDDFSYNIVRDPVEVYDLNATILHLLGIDHTRLTYRFQGRDYRLTDVHGNVVKEILA